jgi:nondiscriminating glutamyl-tRNA synthetase
VTEVRCRFAPAPSGFLHVGGAHTALFSWLHARHTGGTFVVRIEDTDEKRLTEGAAEAIGEALAWLGVDWDEGLDKGGTFGPYVQSERLSIYREVTDNLLASDRAYPCFCTPEELEERRKAALSRGERPSYDGRCRRRSPEERERMRAEGRPFAVRFATPGRDVVVNDLIRGSATVRGAEIEDFVILRSSGWPTYLLAAAVDDHRMRLTHVIRGEDLYPSTARQLLLFEAFGADPPEYAHLPLILGRDRAKLSKRHGAITVESFREQGFLPDAMLNYLALLGWSPGEDREIIGRDEIVERFELADVSHHPAIFDTQKLQWMNGEYIRHLPDEDLAGRVAEFLAAAGVQADRDVLRAPIPLIKERMERLTQAVELLRFLFTDEIAPDEKAMKIIESAGPEYLREAAQRLEAVEDWTVEEIKRVLDDLATSANLNRTKGWQPIRAAATLSTVSPPLPESLELLGKERTVSRLRAVAGVEP